MAEEPFDIPDYPSGPRRPYKRTTVNAVDLSRTNEDLDPSSSLYEIRTRIRAEQEGKEDRQVNRQVLGEMKRQRKTESEVFQRVRSGEKIETDDPALQDVVEAGEQFRRQDRRTAFVTGVGQGLHALGRAMTSANMGGSRRTVTGAARNLKRVPSIKRRGGGGGGSSALSRASKRRF